MFSDDIASINSMAQSNPENFMKVALFVRATVRVHFYLIQRLLIDLKTNKQRAKFMRNNQNRLFYAYVDKNKEALHGDTMKLITLHKDDPDELARKLILLYSKMPGIGIIKSGFLAQLVAGVGGCIDYLNGIIYDIGAPHKKFRARGTEKALVNTIKRYVEVCHGIGTECLWNTWCARMSTEYNNVWETPDEVSKYHLACLEAC